MMLQSYFNEVVRSRFTAQEVGLVGGIVRPVKLNIGGKIKTVPGWPKWDKDPIVCKPGEVSPMVPSASQGAVLYFEPVADNYGAKLSCGQMVASTFRLIYWYDSRRYETFPRHYVIRYLMDLAESSPPGLVNNQYKVIAVKAGDILPPTADLFSKYTYDEAETQYLMPPFDVIAFNIHVRWLSLNLSCNASASFSRDLVC